MLGYISPAVKAMPENSIVAKVYMGCNKCGNMFPVLEKSGEGFYEKVKCPVCRGEVHFEKVYASDCRGRVLD